MKKQIIGVALMLLTMSFVACSDDDSEEKSKNGVENGFEYVDLGLSSGNKWATCNVGAKNPQDSGDYFAWGEIAPKSYYSWSTYKWSDEYGKEMTKYNKPTDNQFELADDAARQIMGGKWFTPTKDDWNELMDNCTWTWTEIGGVKGYVVKSNSNQNSIFIPTAGQKIDDKFYYDKNDPYADYWSSSLFTNGVDKDKAFHLYFGIGIGVNSVYVSDKDRCYGFPIRAVFR